MIEIKQSQYSHPDQAEGQHTNGPPSTFVRKDGGPWYVCMWLRNRKTVEDTIEQVGFDDFVGEFCLPVESSPC